VDKQFSNLNKTKEIMFSGLEDQMATAIAGAISFAAGWLLDNKVPRKVAKWVIGLVWKPKQ
jgi:hypothetical protein